MENGTAIYTKNGHAPPPMNQERAINLSILTMSGPNEFSCATSDSLTLLFLCMFLCFIVLMYVCSVSVCTCVCLQACVQ